VLVVPGMKPCILTFVLLPLTISAQLLTFGVQGGWPAQTPLGLTNKMPFVVGPSVEIHVFSGLSLETGVLYHRLGRGFDSSAFAYPANGVTLNSETWRGSALEIPFLAKYRFLTDRARWRPFLLAGPTVRRTSITTESGSSLFGNNPAGPDFRTTKTTQWNVDPEIGAGIDFRMGRLHIEPEARYSYWGAGKTSIVRKNQVAFLLGARF
jgi:hypothetical protein